MLLLLLGMSTSAEIWTGTKYKSEIDSKSVMVVCYASVWHCLHGLLMWSILFLDFSGVELGETLAQHMNSFAVVYVPELHM